MSDLCFTCIIQVCIWFWCDSDMLKVRCMYCINPGQPHGCRCYLVLLSPSLPPTKVCVCVCVCVCVHLYACGHVCMHVCLCVWVIKSLISNMVSNECDPLKLHCNPLAFHHTSLVWCTNIFCPIVEFSWKRRSTSTSKLQVVMHQVIPPTTWNTGKNTCQINTELRYLYYHRVGPP